MFEASHLNCIRSERILFRDLTFKIGSQSWIWLKGKNGSGKSTLLRMVAGLLLPSSGYLFWQSKKIDRFDPRFLNHLFYLSHLPPLHLSLTPLENLTWWMALQCKKTKTAAQDEILNALQALGLAHAKHLPCEQLSFGEKQRVSLARLGLQKKSFWVLDEPYTGLDSSGKAWVNQQVQEHLHRGGGAIIASHEMLNLNPQAFQIIDLN